MSLRRVALEALMDVTQRGAYANLRLKQAQEGLPDRDAAFVAALVYGTLDHARHIDYILAHYTKGSVKPLIRGILRLGLNELLFMRTPARAACNESVRLTKEVGKGALSGYVNGVMRAVARDKDKLPPLPKNAAQRLCIQYGWPDFIIDEWIERFGAEQTELLLSYTPPALSLRAQPPFTKQDLEQTLSERDIEFIRGLWDDECVKVQKGFNIAGDGLFREGRVAVQGEGAMLCCRALGDVRGLSVLDACAAPGGKAACLYALTGADIRLTAQDIHPHRVELMRKAFKRLRVEAQTCVRDACAPYEECAYDAVLVDAPCSGLGLSKPDIRYAKTDADIRALVKLQAEILDAASSAVKPGGLLVYATCTISKRENELQVNAFLSSHIKFIPEPIAPYIGPIPGNEGCMAQLLPHKHGTEGFFIARMRKSI